MMPTPEDKEDKTKFVARCMASEAMRKDYPDGKQRVAMCLAQATNSKSSLLEEIAENIIISNAFLDTEEIDEHNFYAPSEVEYIDFEENVEDWDVAAERPGLWENIRRKKEREGKNYKPAKRGDKDRPSKDSWKKSQAQDDPNQEVDMLKSQINKIMNQAQQMLDLLKGMTNMDIPPWVQDSVSKSETHIETAYDYMLYSDEKHAETIASEHNSKVKLNKPFRTANGPKKFSVYVKNEKNNVVKVNFGDPNMEIKRDDPERRKSFRARHNCDNPGPKWKANYWSCKMWSKTNVSDLT